MTEEQEKELLVLLRDIKRRVWWAALWAWLLLVQSCFVIDLLEK